MNDKIAQYVRETMKGYGVSDRKLERELILACRDEYEMRLADGAYEDEAFCAAVENIFCVSLPVRNAHPPRLDGGRRVDGKLFLLSQLFGVAVHLPSRAHPLHAREAPSFPEEPPLSFLMGETGAAGHNPAAPRKIWQERTKRSRHKSAPFCVAAPGRLKLPLRFDRL